MKTKSVRPSGKRTAASAPSKRRAKTAASARTALQDPAVVSNRFAFSAEVLGQGTRGSWCHIYFPPEASAFLGKRGNVPIVLSVNGCEFRATARPDGNGRHYVVLNHPMRERSSTQAGDQVSIAIRVDTTPRVVEMPPDLRKELERTPAAQAAFKAMPYSHKKQYVEYIEEAKRPETRAKRIAQSLAAIKDWGAERDARRRNKAKSSGPPA